MYVVNYHLQWEFDDDEFACRFNLACQKPCDYSPGQGCYDSPDERFNQNSISCITHVLFVELNVYLIYAIFFGPRSLKISEG